MIRLTITATGELLGVFATLSEADEFHDAWADKWEDEHPDLSPLWDIPSCTFESVR